MNNLEYDLLNFNSSGSAPAKISLDYTNVDFKNLIVSGVDKVSINNISPVSIDINGQGYGQVSIDPNEPNAKVLATIESASFFEKMSNLAQYASIEELVQQGTQNFITVQGVQFTPQEVEINGEIKIVLVAV